LWYDAPAMLPAGLVVYIIVPMMHGHTSIKTAKYVTCHYGHLSNGLLQNTSAVMDLW